jgi:succinylglutamic semialdehyde dehydrogenase
MSASFSSISPIDGSVVWQGDATPADQIEQVMSRAAEQGRAWRATSVQDRVELVRRYGQQLEKSREELTDLISREVGKLPWDAAGEVGASIAKIELSIQALEQRRSEQSIDGGAVQRRIRYRPLGVSLVLGPFNFPLHLPGGQIIPSLLAGNTVVFKPSDQATGIGQWMTEAWHAVGLPEGVLQMITGGVDTAVAAIDSPHVTGVFLTGSHAAGCAIHRQLAGRPDVLLALELGGNNPIVVTAEVPATTASAIVSFSAFITSGQRCTCARRAIFIESEFTEEQIDALIEVTQKLRIGMPGDDPAPHVGPLISTAAAESLQRTYDQLMGLGCQSLIPFEVDSRAGNLVRPAIVDATGASADQLKQIGRMEWFGPLLVIERVDDFDSAVSSAANTSYGLAASLLGGTSDMFDRFVADVGAGVVNWNGPTTGAAGALPFGGLGDSGNHRPAGFHAIDFCSDPIASLEQAEPSDSDPWNVAQ